MEGEKLLHLLLVVSGVYLVIGLINLIYTANAFGGFNFEAGGNGQIYFNLIVLWPQNWGIINSNSGS